MIIKNVNIFTEKERFESGSVYVKGDRIERIVFDAETAMGEAAEEQTAEQAVKEGTVIDGEGCYCIPGMVDLHFHGCMGADFCDGTREALETIAKYEASVGVTAICPATMTLAVEELEAILKNAAEFKNWQKNNPCPEYADYVGVNMEGPFISRAKKGAQDARFIVPFDIDILKRFQESAQGLVKYIAIAPEEEGNESAPDLIKQAREELSEIQISLAHTNAGYDKAKPAFDAGASHVVHLYNAMPGFGHRDPGVIGAAFESKHVNCEMICDGVHLHKAAMEGAFALMGAERILLISDSMRATGMEDGEYTLGGQGVKVQGNKATMLCDGALAGSVTTLPDCVRNVIKNLDIPMETAIACATIQPAKSLGIDRDYGSISAGKKANLVLWDRDLVQKMVIKDGQIL